MSDATLAASIATLASSGITVKVADVNASITWASAQLGDSVVWYQAGDVNEFHYTEVGNLMVAMTVWDALGYNVSTLDYSSITDVSTETIAVMLSYFSSSNSNGGGALISNGSVITDDEGHALVY